MHSDADVINIDFSDLIPASPVPWRRGRTYHCHQCPQTFHSLYECKTHELRHAPRATLAPKPIPLPEVTPHHSDKFQCDVCGRRCKNSRGLQVHIGRVHPIIRTRESKQDRWIRTTRVVTPPFNDIPLDAIVVQSVPMPCDAIFACDKCDYVGLSAMLLRKHVGCHTRTRQFACHGCERQFYTQHSCQQHIELCKKVVPMSDTESVEESLYKCPRCPYSTAKHGTLKAHISYKHPAWQDQPCPWCEFMATTQETLDNHVKETHSNDVKALIVRTLTFRNTARKCRGKIVM